MGWPMEGFYPAKASFGRARGPLHGKSYDAILIVQLTKPQSWKDMTLKTVFGQQRNIETAMRPQDEQGYPQPI